MEYPIPAALVHNYFTADRGVYRILADKSLQELHSLEGGRLSTRIQGQRVLAVDIAWALRYGNWPKYPLVQLNRNDPFDCRVLENVFPARLKQLRYHAKSKDGKFYHPLSRLGFSNADQCHADWIGHARSYYMDDLAYVLAIEAEERELRRNSGGEVEVPAAPARRSLTARLDRNPEIVKPSKPKADPGMEYHWFQQRWVQVPVAVHVADDYVVRCLAFGDGAVRAEFNPVYGTVDYFYPSGDAWQQGRHQKGSPSRA